MKNAALPLCALAFAALSIAHVVLTHFNLITLGPSWLVLTSYSALIAAAVWLDRRSKQQSVIYYGGAADRIAAKWDVPTAN